MSQLAFKIAYIRQVSVLLIIVKTIADNKKVFNLKADIVSLHIHKSSGRLVEKCADFNALRVSVGEMLLKKLKSCAGVHNVLNYDYILSVDISVKILLNLDNSRSGRC